MNVVESKTKSIYKTYMIYFICMICFLAVRIAYANGFLSFKDAMVNNMFSTIIIQVIIMFLLPFGLYCMLLKVKPKKLFNTCNYYKLNKKAIIVSFAIGIVVFLLNIAVSTFFSSVISFFGYRSAGGSASSGDYSVSNLILDLTLTALLPAFCEEFLHRGMLLQGTKHAGFKRAIIMSAIMFGFMHFNINQFFYATFVGIILGLISVVAKNIWPAVIVHFTNNAIGIYIEYASANKWIGGNFYTVLGNFFSSQSILFVFLTTFIFLALVFIALTYLIYVLYKITILRKVEKAVNEVCDNKDEWVANSPVSVHQNQEIKRVVESTTTLNLNFEEMKNPIDVVLPKQPNKYKTTIRDRVFIVGSFVLGTLVTLFTFLWGVIY